MRTIKIKKIHPGSTFKAVYFALIIPTCIVVVLALIFGQFDGLSSGMTIFTAILICVIAPVLYGIAAAVFAYSYNVFTSRFGGLEIEIDEEIHPIE